jgi:hypothetical protein
MEGKPAFAKATARQAVIHPDASEWVYTNRLLTRAALLESAQLAQDSTSLKAVKVILRALQFDLIPGSSGAFGFWFRFRTRACPPQNPTLSTL